MPVQPDGFRRLCMHGSTSIGKSTYRRVRLRRPRFLGVVVVIVATTTLGLAAGFLVVGQSSDQMTREANARLERNADLGASQLRNLITSADSDLRLARRNDVFEASLARTPEALLPADRELVNAAILYMGERYDVDEICVIRAGGLESARWVGGKGLAEPGDLSPDERLNNPAVLPTVPLPDDRVYETSAYISPDSARWVLGFATPIVLKTGEHAGILHFEIPTERLVEQLNQTSFGDAGFNLLFDATGHLLSSPKLPEFRADQGLPADPFTSPFPIASASGSPSWRLAAAAMLTNDSGSVTFDEGGITYRAAYRLVDASGRVVATVSPVVELYADVDRSRLFLALTVGPLILLILLVSGWFTRRLWRTNGMLEESSRASSELAAIVRAGDDSMMSVEPDGTIATWNAGAQRMYGIAPAQAIGSRVESLFAVDVKAGVGSLMSIVSAGEAIQHHESRHVIADGTSIDVLMTMSPIRNSAGDVVKVAVVVRDISDRKRLESELAHQALHDGLTGLPNRVLFTDRLRHSLGRARRPPTGSRQAVLFIDLDNFKLVNDTLGHRFGDELLIAVARRLNDGLRPGDSVARLGGDEFTVLMESVEEGTVRLVADRILERMREPFELDGHQVSLSASIGIALSHADTDEPDDLLRAADTALYEAKANGKGRHETYQPVMNARVWRRMELESDLRRAISAHEFVLHYQPIVELDGGHIREVEALVRWRHPDRGLLAPGEFIPLAEQTGLIVDIGKVVLRAACAQLAEWTATIPAARDLVMSVNVSPRELMEPGFVAGVRSALSDAGMAPQHLKIELTETVTIDAAGPTTVALAAVREMGVHLSVDDFGTGYSSLSYFRTLPVDSLKIDRLLIEGLGRKPEDSAIVAAAVAFAAALGLEVTCEGIETDEQADELRRLDCTLGQGFLFARPADAVETARLLRRGSIVGPHSGPRALTDAA
jgi:diguanylate cyclase (GGDEF)-like protein/PAS domain S-box-containing protein